MKEAWGIAELLQDPNPHQVLGTVAGAAETRFECAGLNDMSIELQLQGRYLAEHNILHCIQHERIASNLIISTLNKSVTE